MLMKMSNWLWMSLFTILYTCFFLKVTVKAVIKFDNKAAHCYSPVPLRHCPFLRRDQDASHFTFTDSPVGNALHFLMACRITQFVSVNTALR